MSLDLGQIGLERAVVDLAEFVQAAQAPPALLEPCPLFPRRVLSEPAAGRPLDLPQHDLRVGQCVGDGLAYCSFESVHALRERVISFNLPYLALPVTTDPGVAIDVFVKLNTSSVPLRPFDIVVAQVEAATGQPLRDLEGELRAAVPDAEFYMELSELILRVAALRENRSPTQSTFLTLDFQRLVDEWEVLERGVAGAVTLLSEEQVFDRERLPTVAVVPIVAALWGGIPNALDAHGNARRLLRKYLWRSFLTHRYEQAAATAALQDYRGLAATIAGTAAADAPIFNEENFPLPDVQELTRAPWPKGRDIIARGILAISLRGGGRDIADDTPVSRSALRSREYHHLFPDHLLTKDGRMTNTESSRALNCALITWNTNRNIGAKEPVKYLQERVAKTTLGEAEIRRRLASHTIPFDTLNVGGYSAIANEDARAERIQGDFARFLQERGRAMRSGVVALCAGEVWRGIPD